VERPSLRRPLAAAVSPRARLSAFARGPWPILLLVSLAGWMLLPGGDHGMMAVGSCGVAPGAWLSATWARAMLSLSLSSPATLALHWLVMLLAMMAPLIAEPLANLGASVAPHRRPAAVALLLVGYGGVWTAAGLVIVPAAFLIGSAAETSRLPPLALSLSIAALWQVMPLKRAALALCHRRPAASEGAGLRYGMVTALGCFGACWALMLAPFAVHGEDRPLMALVAIALLIERQLSARPPFRLPKLMPSAGQIQGHAHPPTSRLQG
jgi:predicted metal-binding membrane protein